METEADWMRLNDLEETVETKDGELHTLLRLAN
jgi:hypothetical protein